MDPVAFNRNISGLASSIPAEEEAGRVSAGRKTTADPATVDTCRKVMGENGCGLRLTLYRDGRIHTGVDDGSRSGCFLDSVHIQDRPLFLTVLSNAVHENRPIQASFRLLVPEGTYRSEAWFWPGPEYGTVNALFRPCEQTTAHSDAVVSPDRDRVREDEESLSLCLLAQGELLELVSSLTLLCRSATDGPAGDEARLATLRHLARRLDCTAELLGALDDEHKLDAVGEKRGLLEQVQRAVATQSRAAAERHIGFAVEVAGAVREPVSPDLASLLRLMVSSAARMVADAGSIMIVTRREGQAATVSVTLSAVREVNEGCERAAFDLSILRNLSIRRGGRLSIIHRNAPAQQWVLRLPLAACGKGVVQRSFNGGGGNVSAEMSMRSHFLKQDENRA